MSGEAIGRSPGLLARPALEGPIVEEALRATGGAAAGDRPPSRFQLVAGPRGSGRSALLTRVASQLAAAGMLPVEIDMERAGTTPLELSLALPAAVDRALALAGGVTAGGGSRLADLEEARRALSEARDTRRPSPSALLQRAIAYPAIAARASGRRLALMIDEMGEARHLVRQSGMRDALGLMARTLASSDGTCLIATVCPASRPADLIERLGEAAREAGSAAVVMPMPPFSEREMAGYLELSPAPPDRAAEPIERWMRATAGHPLYASILARSPGPRGLGSALAMELAAPHGALHLECRFDYHQLVERSRGHAAVRSMLGRIAATGRASLTDIARHLKIALPTALDYLSWLLEVGLVRRDGAAYVYSDPILAAWVRCNGAVASDPEAEAARLLSTPREAPIPPSRPRGPRPGSRRGAATAYPAVPPPQSGFGRPADRGTDLRIDQLMEID